MMSDSSTRSSCKDAEAPWCRRWAFRLSVLLALTTFPLVWVGGLVTTYDAGMAVPDWPSTYGYNLFLYPWKTWFFGPWDLFIEHGHRLLGSLVGMIAIGLVVVVHMGKGRRAWRGLAWSALLLVLAQGGLGGARVLLAERLVALLHGCIGPVFFSYAVALAAVFSPTFDDRRHRTAVARATRWKRWAWATVGVAYLQLILGAVLRHLPVTATRLVFNITVILHLANAVLLGVAIFLLAWRIGGRNVDWVVRWPVRLLVVWWPLQIFLGGATWLVNYGWPSWLYDLSLVAGYTIEAKSLWQASTSTLHMATGSLVLATAVFTAVRAWRFLEMKTTGSSQAARSGKAS